MPEPRRVLLIFRHGLGDAVQLTQVLAHLKHRRPHWQVDVALLRGKHTAVRGLCRRLFLLEEGLPPRQAYDRLIELDWAEPDRTYRQTPATKADRCVRELLGEATPEPLWRYAVDVRRHVRGDAAAAQGVWGRYRAMHYATAQPPPPGESRACVTAAALARQLGRPLLDRGRWWVRPAHVRQDSIVLRDVFARDSYRLRHLPGPWRTVVDVGAHIGAFARLAALLRPEARIVCVEADPANAGALRANAAGIAAIEIAACTYEPDPCLLSSVDGERDYAATGNSMVVAAGAAAALQPPPGLRRVGSPPAVLTLEQLVARHRLDRIDLLKLDCEGSELSILAGARCLQRVRWIVGEYHGREAFLALMRRRLPRWTVRLLDRREVNGRFWLAHPQALDAEAPDAGPAALQSNRPR